MLAYNLTPSAPQRQRVQKSPGQCQRQLVRPAVNVEELEWRAKCQPFAFECQVLLEFKIAITERRT